MDVDDPLAWLLDYDRRRYWLSNGWSIRFRIWRVEQNRHRPHGLRYSFTLHDEVGERLLGIDNSHRPKSRAFKKAVTHDHRHAFRRTEDMLPYEYKDASTLLDDFFELVKRSLKEEGVDYDVCGEDELQDCDAEETDYD